MTSYRASGTVPLESGVGTGPSVVPVTLVTGFLGSGKTTLLNHILRSETGKTFAVIENEFGMVGVDGSLVDAPKDGLFEINDGCVCCTVQSDLLEVFEKLIHREGEFDHVIIETTGLADPGPVMRLFDRPPVHGRFELQGVVTVVDAAHIDASLSEGETCQDQITYADLLILNKTDSVSIPYLEETESRLRALNPLARILRADHANVDVETVLQSQRSSADVRVSSEHIHEHHDHDHAHHDHDHEHHDHDHDHRHDQAILAVAVEADGEVDIDRLDKWLYSLTRRHDIRVLRMKGLLAVPGQPERFVFHGVRDVIDVRPGEPWGDTPRVNRIVFIGRSLDQSALQQGFIDCIISGSGAALG